MGVCHNIKVNKVQGGVDTLDMQVVNPDTGQKAAITYDAPVIVMVNDRVEFSGKIKRIEKDENINVYTVFAQNAAADLRDLSVATTYAYEHYQPYYIITDLLPATQWTAMQYTGLGDYMDYTLTPGPVLTHLDNVCKQQGWVWDIRQHTQSCTVTDYSTTSKYIVIDYTPSPSDYWLNWYGIVRSGSAINEQFRVTSAAGASLTLNYLPTGIATGDYLYLFGKYYFEFGTRLGSSTTATVSHYTINTDAALLNRKQNVDKIVTSVVAVGQNPEMARMTSWATANTLNYAKLACSETYLSDYLTLSGATAYVDQTSLFPNNGRIQIGDEKIDYTNKTSTSLLGLTRGADSTSPAIHHPLDDVLLVSEMWFDTATKFATTGIWLGMEYITFATSDSTNIYTLTRGANSTPKYRHYYGTYGFDGTYTNDSPEADSPVALYGVKRRVVEAVGATTRDSLDKRAQYELLAAMDNTEYGDFILLDHDFWKDVRIGDHVLVTDKDSADHEWEIVGIDYNQFYPVKIYFGQSDDYILEDIARVDKSYDVAREKNALTRTSTILSLTADSKYAQVKYDDDGTTAWIQLA